QLRRYVSTGMVCVVSLYIPGPNTSATLPSLTNIAICDSRTVSDAPYWISMSCIGYRQASVPSPVSVHCRMSMNCFLMKSIRAMAHSFQGCAAMIPVALRTTSRAAHDRSQLRGTWCEALDDGIHQHPRLGAVVAA